jgi:uncharacterized protein YecE (DUF72 family)
VSAGEVRIGISGWRYPAWRGIFYPEGLAQKDELRFVSHRMRTLEINGSFYALQRPSSYVAWREATPDDFVFAVKGSRFITHAKKLRGCALPLANFFASGVLALGDKLGPLLWQLPPQVAFDAQRLADFFGLLPRTTAEAAELAARHDERVARSDTRVTEDRPVRHALEVRHQSYDDPSFVRLLRADDIALVVADGAGAFPRFEDVTSDFVYARLHGDEELYASGYTPASLDRWAARVTEWRHGRQVPGAQLVAPGSAPPTLPRRDVFVYFDNDAKARAPFDAMSLAARLGERRDARLRGSAEAEAGLRAEAETTTMKPRGAPAMGRRTRPRQTRARRRPRG